MYGWAGQRLRVDLTSGKIKKESLDYAYRRKWLGGRGFNSEVIYHEVPPAMDAFDPQSRICFGVGPISGTSAPATGRCTVSAKSPLTDGFGDSSMGGHWGAELKYASYDQIVIQGRSKKPVYLWIDDDKVEIRDASHLWGKYPREADSMIKEEVGDKDINIVLIGPAGENLVRFACILNDIWRAAGRTGMGAVMGSKNLKGIAVRGSGGVKIANPKEFFKICNKLREKFKSDPVKKTLSEFGTLALVDAANLEGWLPWRNFQEGAHPLASNINAEAYKNTALKHKEGCFACPICCGNFTWIRKGKYAGEQFGGPEYEQMGAIGPRLGIIEDANSVWHNTFLVNDLGMDAVECGGAISWAQECYQKGLITKKDTGEELEWGDQEVVEKLIKMIAYREGFGDVLAEGSAKANKKLGLGKKGEDYLICTRGMTLVSGDPRGVGYGFGLGYAVGTRGGCDHLRACASIDFVSFLYPGLAESITGIREEIKPFNTLGKPRLVFYEENHKAVSDSLEVCCFTTHFTYVVLAKDQVEYLNACTGLDFTEEELLKIGERIYNLERAYWARLLSGKREDILPKRFTSEPLPKSIPNQVNFGNVIDLTEMLKEYYKIRGYEPNTSFPGDKKLKELGLEDVAEELKPYRDKYKSLNK